MRAAGAIRWILRALRVIGLALAGLLLLVLAAYAVLTATPTGRAQLRDLALHAANGALRGQLEAGELARIGITGVTLRDVAVRDPQGTLVLQVRTLELDLAPLRLLSGEIAAARVAIAGATAVLADLSEQRGVLAAFAPRNPSTEPEQPGGEPPRIRIEAIELDDVGATIELAELGVVGIQALHARASFALRGEPEAELRELRTALTRDARVIGAIDSARGKLARPGADSELALRAKLAQTALALDGRGRLPADPAFRRSPIALGVDIAAIDAETLRALGQDALAASLRAPLHLALTADGTPDDLAANLALDSNAGRVTAKLGLAQQNRARLVLELERLVPGGLLRGAPEKPIDLTLEADAEIAQAPARVPFQLRLTRGRMDKVELPKVKASGRVEEQHVRDVVVEARGYGGRLDLTGEAGFDGSARGRLTVAVPSLLGLPQWIKTQARLECTAANPGSLALVARFAYTQARLDADAKLSAQAFAAAGFAAERLDVNLAAHGKPTAPVLALTLEGQNLVQGKLRVPKLALDARGGPVNYDLGLRFEVEQGELELDGHLVRGREAAELSVDARGQLRAQPFALSIPRARIGYDGTIGVPDARGESRGQRFALAGSYDKRGAAQLGLDARGIDLHALSQLLDLEPALVGKVDLRVTAAGHVDAPRLALRVLGRELGAREYRPRAQLELDAALDVPKGTAELALHASSGEQLALRSQIHARFPAGARPRWETRVREAELEGTLAIDPLASELVDAFLPEPLPTRGRLNANFELSGTIAQPQLGAQLRARLRHPERQRGLELAIDGLYARGRTEWKLEASDLDGALLGAQLALERPADSLQGFLDGPERLLHEARWQASLDWKALGTDSIPADIDLPRELRPLRLGGSLRVDHAPLQEPSARLTLNATHAPAQENESCSEQSLALALQAELAETRASATLQADSKAQRLFGGELNATVALEPALAGTGTPRASDASFRIDLAQLELAALPMVCAMARGRLSGRLRGDGLLGPAPQVEVTLRGERLSTGAQRGIDLALEARAREPEATLHATLSQADARSTLEARMPLRFRATELAAPEQWPFEAHLRLDRLPLAPLVPRSFAVSHASGHLNGSIDAGGTLAAPHLRGHLEPQRVALTITDLAQPLRDIDGRLTFTERAVAIERLTARDAGGKLTLRGAGKLARGAEPASAELEVVADKFPLRQQGQAVGEVDARVHVTAQIAEQSTKLQVKLRDASAWLLGGKTRKGISLDPHPDIVDPRAEREREPEPSEETPSTLELALDAQDSFWVRRDDFAVKLSTKLLIRAENKSLSIQGPLQIHRGYLQLFGSTFDIDSQSKLEFIGGDKPDPVLDITAVTTNRDNKRIEVKISGRASAPVLDFTVDGNPVSAGDAAMALFNTENSASSDSSATDEAKSFLAGVMAGVLAMSARREFGEAVPILMLEPQDDLKSTRIRAGFELDKVVPDFLDDIIRGVYVEGIFAGASAEEGQSVQGGVLLELYLPNDFVTTGQYGPGETWSVDLGWEP